jgi:multidrug efflux pump subunit AcrB
LAKENITGMQLFTALDPIFGRDISCANILYDGQPEMLRLTSRQSKEYDVWSLANVPFEINGHSYKLSDFATIGKGLSPQKVAKENQQYRLCLQYDYVGSHEQGRKLLKKDLDAFNAGLPMGYMAEDEQQSWSWGKKDNKQYTLLLLVITIIFFTTSILFNSLKQPLAIIFVIPISYIGVFLTFYLFGLNFDQGGFASFVLLCGITVNASIYIMNEYNDVRHRFPKLVPVRAFVKAWNSKIIPIFLTVVSTILGFIPFMVGTGKEAFWFPLAAGTIGGLVMSVIGIFIFLPIFTLKKSQLKGK